MEKELPKVRPAAGSESPAAKAPGRESAASPETPRQPKPWANPAKASPRRQPDRAGREAGAADKSLPAEKPAKFILPPKGAAPKSKKRRGADRQEDEPAAEAKKLAPPDAALRRKKEAEVREVYSARIAAAATAPQKLALADTLLRKAKETRNDPAGKYVLLESAAQEAKEAGQTAKVFQALDQLDAAFDVNVVSLKVDLLQAQGEKLAKAAKAAKAAPGGGGRRAAGLSGEPGTG